MEDERIIWVGKPEWKGYAIPLIIFGLLTVPAPIAFIMSLFDKSLPAAAALPNLLIGGVPLVIVILYRMQYDYKVTDKRIIAKKGLIGRKIGELEINDIRSINVKQGILQRVLRLGDLEFTSAAGPIKDVSLLGIKNPEYIKDRIREFKDKPKNNNTTATQQRHRADRD